MISRWNTLLCHILWTQQYKHEVVRCYVSGFGLRNTSLTNFQVIILWKYIALWLEWEASKLSSKWSSHFYTHFYPYSWENRRFLRHWWWWYSKFSKDLALSSFLSLYFLSTIFFYLFFISPLLVVGIFPLFYSPPSLPAPVYAVSFLSGAIINYIP